MTAVYIIIAILFFGVLIGIHELGHFAAAKACGVRVEEFAIGMGPALLKKKKGETEYSLRLVPFGGYCAMTGEDGASEDARAFVNQSHGKRIAILVAGSFMNFLLGFVIVLLLYAPVKAVIAPVITEFMPGCPYESAEGLQVGDRFLSINGHRIHLQSDINTYLTGDGSYDLVLERDGETVRLEDFEMSRRSYEGETGRYFGFRFGAAEKATFGLKLRQSWATTKEFGSLVWLSLGELVRGRVGIQDLSGPVGIVDLMAETGEQAATMSEGLRGIFYLGAFIAVNLAVMNMLPIPALDGGRVFLLLVTWLIETITRKKLDPKYEGAIHTAGMVLLLALMAFVMFNDIFKLIRG